MGAACPNCSASLLLCFFASLPLAAQSSEPPASAEASAGRWTLRVAVSDTEELQTDSLEQLLVRAETQTQMSVRDSEHNRKKNFVRRETLEESYLDRFSSLRAGAQKTERSYLRVHWSAEWGIDPDGIRRNEQSPAWHGKAVELASGPPQAASGRARWSGKPEELWKQVTLGLRRAVEGRPIVEQWLPRSPVRLGSEWSLEEETMAPLFGMFGLSGRKALQEATAGCVVESLEETPAGAAVRVLVRGGAKLSVRSPFVPVVPDPVSLAGDEVSREVWSQLSYQVDLKLQGSFVLSLAGRPISLELGGPVEFRGQIAPASDSGPQVKGTLSGSGNWTLRHVYRLKER